AIILILESLADGREHNVEPEIIDRDVSLLLEYYEGQLPGWLSPVQIYVIPVSEKEFEGAKKLVEQLIALGLRAVIDSSGGSLSKRVRFAHLQRPFAKLVVGKSELEGGEFKLGLRDRELRVNRFEIAEVMRSLVARPN
ncbi:MAG: hypothetical protein EOP09_13580, partial [Proteobacteria bacterium]